MMRLMVLAAALATATGLRAAEHPKEHPTGTEHPAPQTQNQTPAQPRSAFPAAPPQAGSREWLKAMNKEYVKAVEDHVRSAKASGGFKVHDDKLGKDWQLDLVRVHKDKVAYLGNNTFFACADFRSKAPRDMSKVDLDFYATKIDAGWNVSEILVHKVNGRPRYIYNMKNERVPVKD